MIKEKINKKKTKKRHTNIHTQNKRKTRRRKDVPNKKLEGFYDDFKK